MMSNNTFGQCQVNDILIFFNKITLCLEETTIANNKMHEGTVSFVAYILIEWANSLAKGVLISLIT